MKYLLTLFLLLLLSTTAFAKDISLAWDASPSTGVVGYKLYTNSTVLTPFQTIVDVGDVLSYTILDIPDDQGLYAAVTAYNGIGQESIFSNLAYSQSFVPPEPSPNLGGSTILNGFILPLL